MRFIASACLAVSLLSLSFPSTTYSQELAGTPNIKVELLEAGTAPMKQLRYTLKAGSKQSVLTKMKSQNDIFAMGTKVMSQSLPAQSITVDTEITKVGSEGTAEYSLKYADIVVEDDPNNPSPQTAAIREMIKPLIGATGSGSMSNRGISLGSKLNLPQDLNPTLKATIEGMQESMGNMSLQFPQEAIGVGGKWRVTMNIKAQGMTMTQVLNCELTKLESNSATVKCALTQAAAPQDVKSPAFPAGTTVKLLSLDGTGESMQTVNFDSLFPNTSTLSVNTSMEMEVNAGGAIQKLKTETKVQTDVSPAAK